MKKTNYLWLAAGITALASCSSEDYLGNEALQSVSKNGEISFSMKKAGSTRGDIYGAAAADLLNGQFVVEGVKGTEQATNIPSNPGTGNPTTYTYDVVFDNYIVKHEMNSAGKTESNTNNWEYVGKTHSAIGTDASNTIGRTAQDQSIKYWDYSQDQYSFVAFSTGKATMTAGLTNNAVIGTESGGVWTPGTVKVTKIDLGTNGGVSYSFQGLDVRDLKECYITDITEVEKANYGNVVTLKFKNLTSKIRVGLYETIPGYSVKDVMFYNDNLNVKLTEVTSPSHSDLFTQEVWGSDNDATRTKINQYTAWNNTTHGADSYKFYDTETGGSELTKGNIHGDIITADNYYDNIGQAVSKYSPYDNNKKYYTASAHDAAVNTAKLFTDDAIIPASGTIKVKYPYIGSDNASNNAYNKAQIEVTAVSTKVSELTFGDLTSNYGGKHGHEADGNYLGITLPTATMAGSSSANYFTSVMPNDNGQSLNLRVKYTLVSTDGSGEEITVLGAKAVVPSTYTKWQPNYAYTYIFKISDNTNGSTAALGGIEGLFPITFDAVVAEATDANAEQTTITTVATPSITTYQQGHVYTATNEYSKLQTGGTSAHDIYVQVMDNSTVPATLVTSLSATNALLYKLGTDATEASVMDALINQACETSGNITGRNALVLTKNTNISTSVTTIANGVDDNPINLTSAGRAAMIDISEIDAGTYAFVYDYTTGQKTVTDKYQPVAVNVGTTVADGLYPLATTAITTQETTANAKADETKLYFSKTTNGSGVETFSFVTTEAGITPVTGLWYVDKSTVTGATATSSTTAAANTFYFQVYKQNNGKYAVKVIKVVA